MNLRLLEIFPTVYSEKGVSNAAKKLYISQPAVSSSIIELEAYLGFKLFDRINRQMILTEPGKLFLHEATKVLASFEMLGELALDLQHAAPIKLGSTITAAHFILPQIINDFSQKSPAKIDIQINNAAEITQKVLRGELDVAIVEGIVSEKELIAQPFSTFSLGIYAAKNHPLAKAKKLRFRELLGENFLLREEGSAIRQALDSYLFLNHLEIKSNFESVNSSSILEAVNFNLGIAVLPEGLAKEKILKKEIIQLDVSDFEVEVSNQLIYHHNKYLYESLEQLVEIILEKKWRLIDEGN